MPVAKSPLSCPVYPRRKMRFRSMNLAVRLMPTGWKYWANSILLMTPVADSQPISVPEPYRWIWAGPEEIAYIDRHPEATSPTAYTRRAARGDRCLCIMLGENVVGYQWVTRRAGCVMCGFGPRMEIKLFPLAPHQAFAYDIYTYRNYRGRGIGTMLKRLLYLSMKEEGAREVLVLVAPDNHASLRLQLRLGAQPQRIVYTYRIRSWNKTFLGPAQDRQLAEWMEQFKLSLARA
jgi:ribosomal protein S18 acetylase RimI-like enzyme